MSLPRMHLAVACAILLSGCSFADEYLWDPLSGESASKTPAATGIAVPPSRAEKNPQPTVSASAVPAAPGADTGTYVGQKARELRADLQRLQDGVARHNQELLQLRQAMAQDASTYHGLVGGLNTRLQVGTTPGNPELVAQWNQAQSALDRIADGTARLSALSNEAAGDIALAVYIRETTRAAYGLQGAVDEDHRQLAQIESEAGRTAEKIDNLPHGISEDIDRQSIYVNSERSNLLALSLAIKNGDLHGQNRAVAAATPGAIAPRQASPSAGIGDRRPLVVIRFDRPDVSYEQALYTAVSRAIERRPEATFDLVTVAPNASNAAQMALSTTASKHNAENVLRSLTGMGLPAGRVTLSATTSQAVQGNEVRVYVR